MVDFKGYTLRGCCC